MSKLNDLVGLPTKEYDTFYTGYFTALGAMSLGLAGLLAHQHRLLKRQTVLVRELLDESWPYLPLEVKEKFNDLIMFYNIAQEEDI